MRVVVTGGAGVFGRAMIDHLYAAGYRDLVSLDIAPLPQEQVMKAKEVRGDIRQDAVVRRAVRDADVLIHSAAALPSYAPDDIRAIDVAGTNTLFDRAKDSGVTKVVHISTAAVYGIPDRLPSLESDELRAYDAYNTAKIDAEEICDRYRTSGMNISVLRPKSFLGPGRLGLFGILFEWAYEGHNFPILGPGDVPYQFLDVRDLCRATERVMTDITPASNDAFNIASNRFSTIRDDFQSVLDAAGHGGRVISLPAGPSVAILKVLSKLRLSPIYRRLYLRLLLGSHVDTGKAANVLGFSAKYSNQEALVANYRWYTQNRAAARPTIGLSHTSSWRQGALRMGKLVF